MEYLSFQPEQIAAKDMHQFILGAVNPRPIAFVSTINKEGITNLAPYSFFNAISSNPPLLVFSANRRPGDHPEKDTLINIKETKECVINTVTHDIWHQSALSSVEFPYGISEFDKSGLTPLPSDSIGPMRVAESPVQMECTVSDIIAMGTHPGSANLIICNVIKMHVKKSIMDSQLRRIDPQKLDIMGRLGRSNYVRVSGDRVMSLYQPVRPVCIGYDALPIGIKRSRFFTGNDLGRFAALLTLPQYEDVMAYAKEKGLGTDRDEEFYHRQSKMILEMDDVAGALKMAMIAELRK